MTLFVALDQRRSVMHRRTIHGLTLAALFAISSEMARADEQVVIVARVYPTPAVSTPPVIAAKREIQKSQS